MTPVCPSVRMATAQAEIIEGFLCPMCMKDFGTVTQLQHHFEDAHNAEDKAVFQQLKGNPNIGILLLTLGYIYIYIYKNLFWSLVALYFF